MESSYKASKAWKYEIVQNTFLISKSILKYATENSAMTMAFNFGEDVLSSFCWEISISACQIGLHISMNTNVLKMYINIKIVVTPLLLLPSPELKWIKLFNNEDKTGDNFFQVIKIPKLRNTKNEKLLKKKISNNFSKPKIKKCLRSENQKFYNFCRKI